MTTGRINQVTFLSERDEAGEFYFTPPSPRSHKGAEASWRGFSDKRRIYLLPAEASKQGSLVFLKPPLRCSSYKAASHKGVNPGMRLSEERTFIVNYRRPDKLYQKGATRLDGFTNVLKLYVYLSGNHTDSFFLLY